jgi:signal peptidase I
MYPTLKDSSKVWMNAWSTINRFDMIAYKNESGGIEIQRVLALPGDTLNIIEGVVYVNGVPSPIEMQISREYIIQPQSWKTTTQQVLSKTDKRMVRHEQYAGVVGTKAFLTQADADFIAIEAKVSLFPGFEKNLYQPTNRQWNMVNYGPLTIPENSYFTLCDARGHSRDSRFDGPVPFNSVLGKVQPF